MSQYRWYGPEWDREWERSRADTEPGFGYRPRADYAEGGDRFRAWSEPWGPWEARPEHWAGHVHREGKPSFVGRGPKGFVRSDARILEDVCEFLTAHPEVDASEIEVAVQNGEVTLSGTVSERRQKRLAEDAAGAVMGVKDVANRLRVLEVASAPLLETPEPGGFGRGSH